MKGVIVVELNLAEDIDAAASQVSHTIRRIREAATRNMTNDIIVAVDEHAEAVLGFLRGETA